MAQKKTRKPVDPKSTAAPPPTPVISAEEFAATTSALKKAEADLKALREKLGKASKGIERAANALAAAHMLFAVVAHAGNKEHNAVQGALDVAWSELTATFQGLRPDWKNYLIPWALPMVGGLYAILSLLKDKEFSGPTIPPLPTKETAL